jgi:hypothetical protein
MPVKTPLVNCLPWSMLKISGLPPYLKLWNDSILVETILSRLTLGCHSKRFTHLAWDYFRARLAFIMLAFSILLQWDDLKPDENGFVHLSVPQFIL